MCNPCRKSDHHAEGYAVGEEDSGGEIECWRGWGAGRGDGETVEGGGGGGRRQGKIEWRGRKGSAELLRR